MISKIKFVQTRNIFLHLQAQYAQVAELVDALVSNTSGSNTVSVRSRPWVQALERGLFCITQCNDNETSQPGKTASV